MSTDIRGILERLATLEGKITPNQGDVKGSQNAQQKSVPQLPALFKPKKITALGAKTDPKHPAAGYMVGAESVEPAKNALEEAMAEIEEDMLSKVRKDLTSYLDRLEQKMAGDDGQRDRETPALDKLEKKTQIDKDLVQKAVDAVEKAQEEQELDEDPTEQELSVEPPPAPQVDPTLAEAGPVMTFEMDDGSCVECWGDEGRGFELRRGGRAMGTRFPKLDHAKMAVDLYKARRAKEDRGQDYLEER